MAWYPPVIFATPVEIVITRRLDADLPAARRGSSASHCDHSHQIVERTSTPRHHQLRIKR
jgi:hypothetical protein